MALTGSEPFGQLSRRVLPTPDSIDTSLVRIRTKAGGVAGAGFLVSDRHILTCAHVIAQVLGLPDDTLEPPSSAVNLDFPRLASHTLLTAEWCSGAPCKRMVEAISRAWNCSISRQRAQRRSTLPHQNRSGNIPTVPLAFLLDRTMACGPMGVS